jgi:hypothetical protein
VYSSVSGTFFPKQDEQYLRDMRIAALVHDVGKLLSVFGERDENVDCMNRVVGGGPGLDGLEVQWNHDEFGWMKLRPYLPDRVLDVLKFHSLREMPFLQAPIPAEANMRLGIPDPKGGRITRRQAIEFNARMGADDVRRARFVNNFEYFDSATKVVTDDIPRMDVNEISELIHAYFPGGYIEW